MLLNIISIFFEIMDYYVIFLYTLLRTTHNDATYSSIVFFSLVATLSVLFTGLVLHETFAKPSPRQKGVMKYELRIGVDMRDGRGIMIPL